MRKQTSLLLCGVAVAAFVASSAFAVAPSNNGRGVTNNENQIVTAAGLSGNTETTVKLLDPALTNIELQMIVASAAKEPASRNGLFKVAKTNKKVADALMDRLEGDVTYRDQIILELVLDAELVQMLINTYGSTHPKAIATLVAASSAPVAR